MKKHQKLDIIRDTGVIAIMRAQSSEQLIAAADAIRREMNLAYASLRLLAVV